MQLRRSFVLFLAALAISTAVFSQDTGFISKMNDIDKKATATYGDAVMLFREQGAKNIALGYKDDEPLTRGMVALMTARYLGLSGSFMYNIFGTERYAFKACVAEGLMKEDGSENDLMSGTELIEVLAKISARAEE